MPSPTTSTRHYAEPSSATQAASAAPQCYNSREAQQHVARELELRSPGRFPIFSKKPGGRTSFKVLKKRISRKTHGCVFRAVAQGHEARPTRLPEFFNKMPRGE